MTDDRQKLSDRFWQAHMTLQLLYNNAPDDDSLCGKLKIREMGETLLEIYNEWRTYIKDPISLDPKFFAAELHHLADKIERGELKL